MRIRQAHPIKDRVKLLILFCGLLVVLINIAQIVGDEKESSIEELLTIAMKPVGSTMYIWGGGWNGEDSAAGASSTRLGLSPQWEKFSKEQTEDYDYSEHRFERENGLDCSGYVGWVLYNTFEKVSGLQGYVTTSTNMAESLAEKGWGELIKNPQTFLPGDIVSMDGHVWICLGTCVDGSVMLVHSSPPGVSVCGTLGEEKSMAVQLATEYMTNYHSKWQERYPDRGVPGSYLEEVTVFRWNADTMREAEAFQKKTAEEVIRLLSSGM